MYFFLRRLYSLIPVFSLGLFLIAYCFMHSKALGPGGPEAFEASVQNFRNFPFSAVWTWLVLLPLIPYFFHLITSVGPPAFPLRYWLYRPAGIAGILFLPLLFLEFPMNGAFYFAGMACLAFHFSQSLWHFLIQWGVTVSSYSRRASLIFCWILFALLMGVNGLMSLDSPPVLDFVRDHLFL